MNAVVRIENHGRHQISDASLLWAQRQALVQNYNRLSAELSEAFDTMPDWAKPGPELLASDGSFRGGVVGHPRDERILPASGGVYRKCRFSLQDAKNEFDNQVRMWPNMRATERRRLRLKMWKKVKRGVELRRLRNAELKARGILEMEEAVEQAMSAFWAVERLITEGPQSADAKAAEVFVHLTIYCSVKDTIQTSSEVDLAAKFIRSLQPDLTGLIREHSELFLSDEEITLEEMPWSPA